MLICKYCKSDLVNSTKCSNCSANLDSTEIIEIPNLERNVRRELGMDKVSIGQFFRAKNTILRDISISIKNNKRF